jgi:hypothetical protein
MHPGIADLARPSLRLLVVGRERQPVVVIPHRGGDSGTGERLGIATDESVDPEDGRQNDDPCLGGSVRLREKAEQAGLIDVLGPG